MRKTISDGFIFVGSKTTFALWFVKFISASTTPSAFVSIFSFSQIQAAQCMPEITSDISQSPFGSGFKYFLANALESNRSTLSNSAIGAEIVLLPSLS